MNYFDTLLNNFNIYLIFILCTVFASIITDFITGYRSAIRRKEATTSKAMKKTIEKIILYYSCVLLLILADICICYFQFVYYDRMFPFLTSIGVLFILFREIKSVYENTSKKIQRKINEDFEDSKKLIETIKTILKDNEYDKYN